MSWGGVGRVVLIWVVIFLIGAVVLFVLGGKPGEPFDLTELDLRFLEEVPGWAIGLAVAALFLGPALMIWATRRRAAQRAEEEAARQAASSGSQESISEGVKEASPGCLAAFFSVFLVFGLGFSLFFVLPAIDNLKSHFWEPVDCEIVESWVETHAGDDGSTYSVEVRYRYRWDGVEYRGERYQFLGGSSSGYKGKQAVVDRLPAGSTATCYVDPEEPSESVLNRGWSWEYLLILFPLVFVAIGGAGVWWALWQKRRTDQKKLLVGVEDGSIDISHFFPEVDDRGVPEVEPGPQEVEEALSPLGKLGTLLFFTVFWNGVVGAFLWVAHTEWKETGDIPGCMLLFLVPFVLVGILLLIGIPYQILALANPRPKLHLGKGATPLGGTTSLTWSFRGKSGRLRDLKIWLEGTERATYRAGTDTHTRSRVFARIPIVELQEGLMVHHGSATIRVPEDTMHSFQASRNTIEWKIHLAASIRRWPDVASAFPFVVLPPAEGSLR